MMPNPEEALAYLPSKERLVEDVTFLGGRVEGSEVAPSFVLPVKGYFDPSKNRVHRLGPEHLSDDACEMRKLVNG